MYRRITLRRIQQYWLSCDIIPGNMNVSGERLTTAARSFEDFLLRLEDGGKETNLFTYDAMREKVRRWFSVAERSMIPGSLAVEKFHSRSRYFGLPFKEVREKVLMRRSPMALSVAYIPMVGKNSSADQWRDSWQPDHTFGLYGFFLGRYPVGVEVTRYVKKGNEPVDIYVVTDSYVGLRNPRRVVGGTGWSREFQQFAGSSLGLPY